MGKFKRNFTRQIYSFATVEELHNAKIVEQLMSAVGQDLITPNEGKVLMELAVQKYKKLQNGAVVEKN